jgi:hypothetical protein
VEEGVVNGWDGMALLKGLSPCVVSSRNPIRRISTSCGGIIAFGPSKQSGAIEKVFSRNRLSVENSVICGNISDFVSSKTHNSIERAILLNSPLDGLFKF